MFKVKISEKNRSMDILTSIVDIFGACELCTCYFCSHTGMHINSDLFFSYVITFFRFFQSQ